jgi:hypothetical protein
LAPIFQPKILEILGMIQVTGPLDSLALEKMRYLYLPMRHKGDYPRTK